MSSLVSLTRTLPPLVAAARMVGSGVLRGAAATNVARTAAAPHQLQQCRRSLSDKLHEKESQQEKDYVNRQERLSLKLALMKLDQAADPGGKKALVALDDLLVAHEIAPTEKLKGDLIEWKAHSH